MKTETRQEIDFGALARKYLSEKTPFCLIRFPNEQKTEFYNSPITDPVFTGKTNSSKTDHHLAISAWNSSNPDFFYAPFQPDSDILPKGETVISSPGKPDETSFDEYKFHFQKFQSAFAKGTLRKAILSRIKNRNTPKDFDPIAFFKILETAYPAALVYVLLHPTEGLWIGASPEILLTYHEDSYKTISLAGTQARSQKPYSWTEKEIDEQELVSQHIREQLSRLKAAEIRETKPKTVEAGSVAHLCSNFHFTTENAPADYPNIIARLHPTPAIAGLPVAAAVEIINKTESHDRRLYTGTIGRKKGDSVDYYVNLRCMQVFPNSVSLYLGGGITAGSTLQSEWDETEKKGKTLLNWMDNGE